MTSPTAVVPTNRRRALAEAFGDSIPDLVAAAGGLRSTGFGIAAMWWVMVERGDFGRASQAQEDAE